MKFEMLVSNMMRMNTIARLWHWRTDIAQHHTTFEQFLTQNEVLTDSLMESALGNEFKLNLNEVGVKDGMQSNYSIDSAIDELKSYRGQIFEAKQFFGESKEFGTDEFITILDGVTELTSKTLYLLKLK